MDTHIFEDCKGFVSVPEAVIYYGYQPNRSGFIVCPFHAEKTASLHLKKRSWRCFGCNEGGSVIDFVGKLFCLSPLDAVKKLNSDFHLGLALDRPSDKQQVTTRQRVNDTANSYEHWRNDMLRDLNDAVRVGHKVLLEMGEREITPAEAEAIRWHEVLEDWADALSADYMDIQIGLFRDREGVERVCKRILTSTPQKSNAS